VSAIRTDAFTKTFRARAGFFGRGPAKTVVDSIDLEVADGELFVLLGRNGAGKTTLVKMLSTLVLPTSGSATIYGRDVDREDAAVRRLIGLATPEERSFYWRISGRQNLEFFAALHGLFGAKATGRISELVEALDLSEFIDRRFDSYSSGMKQRLAIARSLLGRPRLLILDEPTRSLDPTAQKQIRSLVQRLQSEGMTIVLVTHQLDEARELGDRIGFMENGRLQVFARDTIDPASLF